MILTRNWLAKFMNLNEITNDAITTALNSLGFEVEQTLDYGNLNKGLVIGFIEESTKIPQTHLSLNKVRLGQDKIVQIVCGAPNVEAKTFVIIAPIGATIANGLTMSKKEIKGYPSEGMICALSEIGLAAKDLTPAENENIYVIQSYNDLGPLIGQNLSALSFDDFTWELDLTLNRSDALGAVQLLKELGNYFHTPVNYYRLTNKVKTGKKKVDFSLKIDPNPETAVRTAGFSFFEINNDEGTLNVDDDLWLKFNHCPREVNYLYDLANKMALEIGQPVILIDYDKLSRPELSLTTTPINGQELLALKDNQRLVQVLGQGVEKDFLADSQTKRLLILYFNFDPVVMRGQQKKLNQANVALQRYVKPTYGNKFEAATEALKDIFDDYALVVEAQKVEYLRGPMLVKNKIETNLTTINHLLGTEFDSNEIKELFKFIDFELTVKGDNLTFLVDPNRIDLKNEKDLAEEVARFYGYDQIKPQPLRILGTVVGKDLQKDLESKITTNLLGAGLTNTKTYSLVEAEANKDWNLFNLAKPVKLSSPLSQLHAVYRLNLVKSLLDVATYNAANGNKNLKLFEIADLYYHGGEHTRHLSLLLSGDYSTDFRVKRKVDFYDLKGILESIFSLHKLDLTKISYELLPEDKVLKGIHPYQNAKIKINNKILGFIFCLSPQLAAKHKLGPTIIAEIDLDSLFKNTKSQWNAQQIAKFQATTRDISLEVPDKISYSELINNLLVGVMDVVDYQLVDVYQDATLKANQATALSISITFNNFFHQLNDQQLNLAWNQVLSNVQKLNLKVR